MIMKRLILFTIVIINLLETTISFITERNQNNRDLKKQFWNTSNLNFVDVTYKFEDVPILVGKGEDVGEPLYLTSYIESGNIEEGKQKAFIQHPDFKYLKSYAGYLTIDKKYNSNTFFWFFQSENDPKHDPLMLWMVGGPGVTIFTSVFIYNGPIDIDEDEIIRIREQSYTTNRSVLYIDSPLGSGFSFTNDEKGYATNAIDVAKDILNALKQFFILFPEYQQNHFYIGGDSYAGKFVVTVADAVKKYNEKKFKNKINLRGLVIGNGVLDPHKQAVKADFLYNVGLFDKKTRDLYKSIEKNPSGKNTFLQAIFKNVTGYDNNENILNPILPFFPWFYLYVQGNTFRKIFHVGNNSYSYFNYTVKKKTKDLGGSVTQILEKLLENYKILLYHGQLDAFIPYTTSTQIYRHLKWSGADEFEKAERKKIYFNNELVGYRKIVKNLHEVLVRNSGHVASLEQLVWCSNLLTEFMNS